MITRIIARVRYGMLCRCIYTLDTLDPEFRIWEKRTLKILVCMRNLLFDMVGLRYKCMETFFSSNLTWLIWLSSLDMKPCIIRRTCHILLSCRFPSIFINMSFLIHNNGFLHYGKIYLIWLVQRPPIYLHVGIFM